MQTSVRVLRAEDLDRAAAIEATASEAWSRGDLAEELTAGCGRVYGLWDGELLKGVAVFQLVVDEASLLTFTVDPAFRRQGLGEQLLRGCLDLLREEGAASCFLEVRSRNLPAVTLYEKLGFARVGLRRNFYHDPEDGALLMKRETL